MQIRITLLTLCLIVSLNVVAKSTTTSGVTPEAEKTYRDIKATLGIVPTFIRQFPEAGIEGAWTDMKTVQLNPNTMISGKYKELIGLAVSSQIPCKYCALFHTEAARLNGATDEEIREAVATASLVRKWSTVLNGVQTDEAAFRSEVKTIIDHTKAPRTTSADMKPEVTGTTADATYAEIQRTLGTVPQFLRSYPEAGIAGAWSEFKNIQLSSSTAIPPKYKELMGLAVAAQIPCRFCVVFHTESLRANGATDKEIRESIAVASIVRHWSTFLNGVQSDEGVFRREVKQIVTFLKRKGPAVRTSMRTTGSGTETEEKTTIE